MIRKLLPVLTALILMLSVCAAPALAAVTSLPISDEPVTLSIFLPMNATLSGIVNSMNDTPFFQELERRTNVHLDFITPAIGQETTAYNLMIASGELPDIIFNRTGTMAYADGIDAAIEDGYFLDLTNLVQEYMPNYEAVRTRNDFLTRASVTDAGRIGAVYQIASKEQGPFIGLQIRQDWLDDLGLSTPVTYDDWETVLTAFKNEKGATAPMLLGGNGYNYYDNNLSAGYGVSYSFYQVDGAVKYGPVEDGWKNYVSTMHRWYEAGLIDPDYMTATSLLPDSSLITTNKTGAWTSIYTLPAMYEAQDAEQNAVIMAVAAPKVNAGDTVKIRSNNFEIGVYVTISAECKHPDIALKWLDYLFSEEGALLCNYGIEGDTFTYNAEGQPEFTDKVKSNPDGLSFSQAMAYYTMPPSNICLQDWTRELSSVPAKDIESYDIWGQTTTENNIPTGVTMTSDETKEYAKIMADITALVEEKTNHFITGVESMDDYDTFVGQIRSLHIDRAIELQQAALDRFLSR